MSKGQCWSLQAEGVRCAAPAEPSGFFCSRHRHVRAADASRVWLAPEGEMPRELVATLRRAHPALRFPAPEPPGVAAVPSVATAFPPSAPASSSETSSAAGTASEGTSGSPELEWLLAILRAALEGVMAGEGTPLQKASAIARLAGQYLKAYGAGELRRENQTLTRRLKAAEVRVAEREIRLAAAAERSSAPTPPHEAVSPAAALQPPPEPERRPASIGLPDRGWGELKGGAPPAVRPAESDPAPTAGAIAARECVPP